MKVIVFTLLIVLPLALCDDIFIDDLRVNYLTNPVGITAPPRFSWVLFSPTYERGVNQASYRIQVYNASNTNVWDSGVVQSASSTLIHYAGSGLASSSPYTWFVLVVDSNGQQYKSEVNTFATGLITQAEWRGTWITGGNVNTQIRKEFALPNRPLAYAYAHVSGLGYFELNFNGKRVGDHFLDVGWTDYAKRVYYVTHDITDKVMNGQINAMAVSLGNSWFSCLGGQPGCINTPPQLLLQAVFMYTDGSRVVVTSDNTWRAGPSPITYNSLYNGETYDARLETPGWASANYNDTAWPRATAASFSPAKITSQSFEPIRRLIQMRPVSVSTPAQGIWVFDFGQNTAGVVRMRVRDCPAGTEIVMRHAELLMHPPYGPVNGQVYTGNLRSAKATDTYICKGDPSGIEEYTPLFTQHGFRFVQVTGLPQPPLDGDFVSIEMHSDVEEAGDFSTIHPLINKIHHLVLWGQKSNLMSVPTDCPNRDERRGWMGDAGLTAEEANLNYRMGAFFTNWLNIIRDDQNADGSVADFVPSLGDNNPGAPNWQSAYPSILWVLYRYNGDKDIVMDHWDALQKYFAFFDNSYKSTGLKNFRTGYGDWVPPPPNPMSDGHLVGAFAYLHDLTLYAEMADGVGQKDVAKNVRTRLQSLATEFHNAFYDSSRKVYGSGLQTEMAMALWLGVVPANDVAPVLNYLVNDIQVTNKNHVTTGIIGWKYLLEVLTQYGVSGLGIQLNLENTYPSFGYMIEGVGNYEPATTIWELWDSDKEGPGMNSRNHIMFGTVGAWFYKTLLGINPSPANTDIGQNTGFDHVTVGPDAYIVNSFNTTSASGRVTTPHGMLSVDWEVSPNNPRCANVPENTAVTFSCGAGTVTGFSAAFYGTPAGDCLHGFQKGPCDTPSAKATLEKQCNGKASCSFTADNDFFGGDPCFGTAKSFAGIVQCSNPTPFNPYKIGISIPVGSSADVVIPIVPSLGQTPQNLVIIEGSSTVWSSQKYVPGIKGISGASMNSMNTAVIVKVSSGSYYFNAAGTQ